MMIAKLFIYLYCMNIFIEVDKFIKDSLLFIYIYIQVDCRMRFFLKIKQNGKQIGTKRIQSKHEFSTTDQLLSLVCKSLSIEPTSFILRIINDQNKFRVIAGWTLLHYSIKAGLQLEVQLLSSTKQLAAQSVKLSQAEKVGEVLFSKQQMGKIIQQNQQQGEKDSQISKLVQKKYQQLLKLIQKNNTQAYIKQIKQGEPSLGPCQNQYFKKQLIGIQNELGVKGWAAIHNAVFAGNSVILNYLIEIGVDLNIKTTDQWLPIQLAVRQQNLQIIDILVAQPNLNINICTAHGLVINMAVQSMNMEIVQKLLMKDVNFAARDHLGRTVYDVLGSNPDKNMLQLLNKEERRQSISCASQKNIMYHALITSFRGEVVCVKTPPRKDKQYYLCINPYEQSVKIYEQKIHYPQHPKQILLMSLIYKFKKMSKSQKSWYMKSDLFYFLVETSKAKYIFGCHFQQTTTRWVQAYNQCLQNVNMYPQSIKQFQRNDSVIMDRLEQQSDKKKTNNNTKLDDLISLFTSKCQERTSQSVQKIKTPVNGKQNKNENLKPLQQNTQNSVRQKSRQRTKESEQTKSAQSPKKSEKDANQLQANFNKNSLKFSDFKIIKTLGEGTFGTVFLAVDLRNPEKRKKYALKCFKKKKLVVNKQIKYTVAQLTILKQLSHPFIVNLHFTFQTPNYVYLGLDYCQNKDLSHHLMNEVTFPQKQAMIYAAQILTALEYLHQKNIIYRDLKPENIMLDGKGHVRLVDFGLSKQGQDRDFVAKSFCGSPAYLSPEMLIKKGVGKESDFYCLGAVLYEMIVGEPPFFSDDIITLYNNISSSKLTFPKNISSEAKSLLIGLLERKPEKRLGYKGVQQIKNHQFFKDINWSNLLKKAINAPVRQQVQIQQQDDNAVVQILHKDFDYSADNYRINRFLNFSFVREENNNDQ